MTERRDVVVVGGGPAGLSAAARCAREGLSVALFERGDASAFRVGETLSAEVGAHLRELGAWGAMEAVLGEQARFVTVSSAWGSDALEERSTMFHPLGAGWHVDRARFDRGLLAWARAEGVEVRSDAGSCAVARDGEGFVVTPRRGHGLWGRLLLDASGRGAPATASLPGRRWLAHDRQVAIVGRLSATGATSPGVGLYLEAVEEGFWYSAPMADGTFVAVLLTDADVLPSLGRDRDERFARALSRAAHTAARTRGLSLLDRPRTFRSDSGRLVADRGEGWRAIGDAAIATDPLGGNGVARALKGAIEACASLDAPFDSARAEQRFSDYLDQRTEFYWIERRWPDAPFWARRRPVDPDGRPLDWKRVEITLDPEASLVWRAPPPPAAEAWLPRAALTALRTAAAGPVAAHVALSALSAVAPIGTRRLLVGLQWLLSAGVLSQR